VSTSATAQYGARAGAVGVAGTGARDEVAVAGGAAVGEGIADCDGDGLGDRVGVMLGLGAVVLTVGRGVGVEEASGGAHVSTSDAATARCRGAVKGRRATCSSMEIATGSSGR